MLIKQQIRGQVRRIWSRYSPERETCLWEARTEVKYKLKSGVLSKKPKILYTCASCNKGFQITGVQVDHIEPVGATPEVNGDWGAWVAALFCKVENLQVLCKGCHKKKSAKEKSKRSDK